MLVPKADRKRHAKRINSLLGPDGRKGTVADWMVVKEGVSFCTSALAAST